MGRRGGLPRCPAAPRPDWHLWIDETPRPGWANMAIDTSLLERAERLGEGWLRLYRWKPSCLSFGRHEPATRRYDIHQIEALGLDTVRRPTGGRAVWHARELTYAVAAPSARLGSLQSAYLEIHRMIAEALECLGAMVSLAPQARAAPLDAGACFAQPSGGEVLCGDRKIVGSAQYRQGNALLQHGSVLLANDQHMVAAVTRGAGMPADSVRENPSGLLLKWSAVAEAVAHQARDRWHGRWETASNLHHVLHEASGHNRHYQSAAWTWVR